MEGAFHGVPGAAPGTFVPQQTMATVLCCLCGVPMQPNPSNMCVNCIRSQVDITDGIPRNASIIWCQQCGRYLQPPKHWVTAGLESKELLQLCLSKLKPKMKNVQLTDAGFVWTEPHSRRIKVKCTVQQQVFNGAILQQQFVTEFVVESNMCGDCNRANTNREAWKASVQLRQHVEHKRTFFYLEQLILKHNADENCISIKSKHEGLDFYFSNRSHAVKLIDFLQNVVPVRFRHDKQLVSHNIHESTYNYKYTFSVEMVPICKDDLICLPRKLFQASGGVGPIVLCTRVTNVLTLLCPATLQATQLNAEQYWRWGFRPLMTSRQLSEFVVLDVEGTGVRAGKHELVDVEVARAADLGQNNDTYVVRSHLGNILKAGDTVLGYDLAHMVNDGDFEEYAHAGTSLPDIVLVRKSYQEKRRKRREAGHRRAWKLRQLAMEEGEEGVSARQAKELAEQRERDRERFLEELEEDPELRKHVNLYRDAEGGTGAAKGAGAGGGESDDEVPEVPLEELLEQLAIQDAEMEEGGE